MPWGNPGLVLASRLQRRRRCRKPGLGKYAVLEVIRRGAADVIMTDLHQEGGLAAMKKVLGLCEMAGLPFVNHAYNATTLTITAHMHAMSSSSAYMLALQGHPDLLR